MSTRTFGLEALSETFQRTQSEGRAAFLPYFPIGFPSYEASLDAVQAMAEEGVDGFEIGIPFSDPLADGPTIQAATQIALQNGTTVRKCLEAVQTLRNRGVQQPMLMMSYANPLIAYGVDDFVRDAKSAGADGLIIPDLPPEEAALFADACNQQGLALIFFLAPTSDERRIELVAQNATGFIYVVSLTGITGARDDLPEYLQDLIKRIRAKTSLPLVLGFGISTPDHVKQLHGLLDGFIVGSALVKAGQENTEKIRLLAKTLRRA